MPMRYSSITSSSTPTHRALLLRSLKPLSILDLTDARLCSLEQQALGAEVRTYEMRDKAQEF